MVRWVGGKFVSAMTRPPAPLEKVEQANSVQLLRSIGADVWVLGTTRAKTDYQGTRQTPGLPDVLACLPARDGQRVWLAHEVKRIVGGRLSEPQKAFAACCAQSAMLSVVGGLDALIAALLDLGYLRGESAAYYRGLVR